MFSLPNLPVFLLAALILLLTPGPAVLYIVARSLDQGRLAGFVSVLSIEIGNFVHVLAATLGLSAILVSSALAFSIVKYLGAAYLIYLGLRRLFTRESPNQPTTVQKKSLGLIFRRYLIRRQPYSFSPSCHNLLIHQRAQLHYSYSPLGVCLYQWPLSQTGCTLRWQVRLVDGLRAPVHFYKLNGMRLEVSI
jgi:hypothetical protein